MKRLFPLLAFASLGLSSLLAAEPYQPEYLQGNMTIYPTSGSLGISSTAGAYIRFTATETTSATSVSINLNTINGSSPITFGIQAESGGGPSGTFLGSNTTVSPATGWNTVSLSDVSLVAGQVYYLVVNPTEAGSTANLRRMVIPAGTVVDYQTYGVRDTNYLRNGSPNPVNTDAVLFVVGTSSGRGMGLAYMGNVNTGASTLITTTAPLAQRFQFVADAPGHTVLDSLTLRLLAGADNNHSLQISILDDSDNLLTTRLLDAADIVDGLTDNYTVDFGNELNLTDGAFYRIAVHATGTGTNNLRWVGSQTGTTDSIINSATFQGVDAYGFGYTNTNFDTVQNINTAFDYVFSYTTVAIPEPGTVASFLMALVLTGGIALRRNRLNA